MEYTLLILGILIGVILTFIIKYLSNNLFQQNEEMSGVWFEILHAYDGLNERWDKLIIEQRGNRLKGAISRISPSPESDRKWEFVGYIHGLYIVGIYYIINTNEDSTSYGTIILKRDTTVRNEAVWRGRYTRPEYMDPHLYFAGQVSMGTMLWQRTQPKIKIY